MVALEPQYFEECRNHEVMRHNVAVAIWGLEDRIQLVDIPGEDQETAT